jgi:predicted NAD-dependent protein-ADP-ribosyltransferase YbiA (DUF1768 family)
MVLPASPLPSPRLSSRRALELAKPARSRRSRSAPEASMTIRFSSPADEPYGCFHPDSRAHGFREDGAYWPSVTQYLLARGLADPKDRERVRMNARDVDDARAMAAAMPRLADADADARVAREADALLLALRRAFETNLASRAVLISTGDARIEAALGDDAVLGVGLDGRGENRLGVALQAVRVIARERADRVNAIQCEHPGVESSGATGHVCACLLATRASHERPRRYHRRFTGVGATYDLICSACRDALPAAPPLRLLCSDCFEAYLGAERLADVGAPAFPTRPSGLRFAHRLVPLAGLDAEDVIAATPIARMPHVWLALRRDGALVRFDVARGAAEVGGRVDPDAIDLAGSIELHVSPGGGLAVVGESKGRRALVLEPATGSVLRALERDDYHPEHCRYPLGLFELDGRLLLVHATEWNRLDVMDPRTGECLTERASPKWASGAPSPAHALDYFHAGLVISPDGERVLDNGWIWHPWGEVRTFSLRALALENRWESEDGESVRALAGRSYYWDGPATWLDARTVAVWGDGDDDTNLTPAARLFDVETGEERGSFAGPARGLALVRDRLVAFDAGAGTSVWDWRTGERLAQDPSFTPSFAIAAHPRSQELLSRAGEGGRGAFRVSELIGD